MEKDKKTALETVGTALYGSRWQSELARDLGVDSRLVRQWIKGERPMPNKVFDDLRKLLRVRRTQINDILEKGLD